LIRRLPPRTAPIAVVSGILLGAGPQRKFCALPQSATPFRHHRLEPLVEVHLAGRMLAHQVRLPDNRCAHKLRMRVKLAGTPPGSIRKSCIAKTGTRTPVREARFADPARDHMFRRLESTHAPSSAPRTSSIESTHKSRITGNFVIGSTVTGPPSPSASCEASLAHAPVDHHRARSANFLETVGVKNHRRDPLALTRHRVAPNLHQHRDDVVMRQIRNLELLVVRFPSPAFPGA